MISDVEHLVMYLLAICMSSLKIVYSVTLPILQYNFFLDIDFHVFIYFGDGFNQIYNLKIFSPIP